MTNTLGPYELNTIIMGDSRELAEEIPDESLDLIFTDPVYDRIGDYVWLSLLAQRILKPHGVLLVWSNGKWHYPNTKWIEDIGMIWRRTFAVVTTQHLAPMNGKIVARTNRLIWFDKSHSSKMTAVLADGFSTIAGQWIIPKVKFNWSKSDSFTIRALVAFSRVDDIIADFFVGQGTLPACCKITNRDFLAFEIDPITADLARQRLAQTQPPLPIKMPEQLPLWGEEI